MFEPALQDGGPKTPLLLELTVRAAQAVGHDRLSRRQAVYDSIRRGLSDVMSTLGVPGHVVVDSEIVNELPGGRFLRLFVNDRLCRYSNDLLQSAQSYVTGQLLDPEATPEKVLESFRHRAMTL